MVIETADVPPRAPDVSVVVAAYNAMPYLTKCLQSLLDQTIGTERMELVAVDDGSTDETGAVLDEFAQTHPEWTTVVHQANSGSPAGPKNRALDVAQGRYVFFADADDYLGPEALDRLVSKADELGSDVVVGRMVGVNGRYVYQAPYLRARTDATFEDSPLAWSLSNTKLFRRSMIEDHRLRFVEDLPVGSDQPFTIEACLRAGRVTILDGDYVCYYAVRRDDGPSITYDSSSRRRLECTARIMRIVADLTPPGPTRDAILVRHFNWELAKLFEDPFLQAQPDEQFALAEGVAALLTSYWTDPIAERTPVRRRTRLLLSRTGDLVRLAAAARDPDAAVPILVRSTATVLAYPDYPAGLDDMAYAVREEDVSRLLAAGVRLTAVEAVRGGRLRVTLALDVRASAPELLSLTVALADRRMPESSAAAGARRLPPDRGLNPSAATVTTETWTPHGEGAPSELTAVVDLRELALTSTETRNRFGVRVYPVLAGRTYEVPVPATGLPPVRCVVRSGLRRHVIEVAPNTQGRLVIRVSRRRRWAVLTGSLRQLWRRGESNP